MSAFGWWIWLAFMLACLAGGAWAFKNSEGEREQLGKEIQNLRIVLGEALLPSYRQAEQLLARLMRKVRREPPDRR